uniref:Uncharacterized protein n=1 Tax=Arundo donax TaxID=35708 RepID=A0A0A8XY60_ARUDO
MATKPPTDVAAAATQTPTSTGHGITAATFHANSAVSSVQSAQTLRLIPSL